MASLEHTTVAGARALGFASAISALVGRVAAWNDARVTRAALAKLTDHELDDIGLCRGDIDTIR
jgi:uncharacterized protein YjiS (DUF1127 family)